MTFNDYGFNQPILDAIADLGYETPTEIQQKAYPELVDSDDKDLVGLAQTGTGKTAAFGLPMLNRINTKQNSVQGLIVCPTRELCIQIGKDLHAFGKNMKGLAVTEVYGGTPIDKQISKLKKGTHIVVATPGRLIDLINRRRINLQDVQVVVLDEADEMLNMGFKEDIDQIFENVPSDKNVWLFSATMPKEVGRIAKNYMNDPVELTVGHKNSSAKNIDHLYCEVYERDRYGALKRLLDFHPDIYGLIFCRTRHECQDVASRLLEEGYNTGALHGDLSQQQRDSVMDNFRKRNISILTATDVAARGIDINDITHVINYKLPDDVENYTHRSGRTARAGKKGTCISIVNPKEGYRVSRIKKIIQSDVTQIMIPGAEEICQNQLIRFVAKLSDKSEPEMDLTPYEDHIKVLNKFTKAELIQKLVGTELSRLFSYYDGAKDLNKSAGRRDGRDRDRGDRDRGDRGDRRDRGERRDRGNRDFDSRDNGDFVKVFVDKGLKDGLNKGMLIRLVCDAAGVTSESIGKLSVGDRFSFIDLDKSIVDQVVASDVVVEGDSASMEVAKSKADTQRGNRSRSGRDRGDRGGRDEGRRGPRSDREGRGGGSGRGRGHRKGGSRR